MVTATAGAAPQISDTSCNVTYRGIERNGIEVFLGIPYAQDTSGGNRFKAPRAYVPPSGSTIDATKPGHACPQPLGEVSAPLALRNITDVSEDCLNLNVARPKIEHGCKKLPVMVFIHGGSFWSGSNAETTTAPDGMIRQSVENGAPIIHVAMNYRLGCKSSGPKYTVVTNQCAVFGFAQSDTLKAEGSENAGLRDQRLAIEWVRDNIEYFGGDPDKITIFGQSSGGLAIGMQILAYGGTKPLPFQQGIAESQSLEPGITGNFARDAMSALVDYVSCDASSLDSPETIQCLRQLDTDTLLNASITTYASDITHNVGDIWLPVVDDDFLPAPPSQLIAEGRFGNATFMSGWTQDDLNYYTDPSIVSANDTYNFIGGYLPGMSESSLDELLGMYPVEEFPPGKDLSSEFYRAARIFRDSLMVCPSIHLGVASHETHSTPVFFYDFNSTILDAILAFSANISGLGAVHTSEFAYIFDSFSAYNVNGYPVNPTEADYELSKRASRSWSTYANQGSPSSSKPGSTTLKGWEEAFERPGGPYFMVIGGPHEGLSALGGTNAKPAVQVQKLDERCAFLVRSK
ncbi:hypothetical protein N0V83_009757 [Neocucurbitaria cava]|uniref:Carboxylic ester hydrolase n=1 Tax=Neocucurbitaria cava TaxID=798079 RepID=A0A9W9CI16_9PLEO|nr:hypothetical protein N0V83_009757 [Neocucurbitaria cava]